MNAKGIRALSRGTDALFLGVGGVLRVLNDSETSPGGPPSSRVRLRRDWRDDWWYFLIIHQEVMRSRLIEDCSSRSGPLMTALWANQAPSALPPGLLLGPTVRTDKAIGPT
jgi:hypothetical protein